ncbi:DnaJ-domain-containing protein [Myriangium duriaei CBS 260.36]|uniref:DnaJ-domain-containing protein n=1 Tax=Myriangium duriaei CBS 260.36 TaxID=1168546 RepID=A0A9P4JCX2_9PEZI|nr:DnaJ-domain-containing protein [Myriangium duriaei CBS 260.36]
MASEELDLYELLGVPRSASAPEIKKAYHKAALSSHPDKVPEEERADADVKFKAISQAYEILSDPQNREIYDTQGMAGFERGGGGGGGPGGVDLDDILAQMFGGGMGGMGGMPGMGGMGGDFGGGGRGAPKKGRPEVQEYEVSLEELYKGKTTKFASTKNVICATCKGEGGREGKKGKKCGSCEGKGVKTALRPVGPGLVTQETLPCTTCAGRGSYFADKDKCRKCKGARVVSQRKILELYVPRGAREGEKIVLPGEADQVPGQSEPGDLVFTVVEKPHETFVRAGADLSAEIEISLAEALAGFSRTVLTHLDGRGIRVSVTQPKGKVLRPHDVLLVKGEGMPVKRSDERGDLYLILKINFPEDGWLKDDAAVQRVQDVLPRETEAEVKADVIDDVSFEILDNMDNFGAGSGDPRGGAEWEDEDDEDMHGGGEPQCAQQ